MSETANVRTTIANLLSAGNSVPSIVGYLTTNRATVYHIKTRLDAGKYPQLSPQKCRKTTLTPSVVAGLCRRIKAARTKSLKRVAQELGVAQELVPQVIKESGWRSLTKVKVPIMSEETRERGTKRAEGLTNNLTSARPHRIVFFSDGKTFLVDPSHNPQNDRWIDFMDGPMEEGDLQAPQGKFLPRSKHAAGAMMLGAIASTGEKSPPI